MELLPPDQDDGLFDAGFFGLSPREADAMEPQQRAFLEAAWVALEDGGWSTEVGGPRVGVYAGANFTSYFEITADSHLPNVLDPMIGADKDYLATRVAHHLGLQGPAMTVQTACSTSLVATHLACRALAARDCDAAIAGGVGLTRPRMSRYFYTPGAMLSPDGHCRAFDAEARGTVFTEGVGAVLLMRLEDAVARGHPIYAVIRGSAVNNDGGGKASYLSPSIAGQERVIRDALANAGISADQLDYVEAHGTATVLGDAIELAALNRVFRSQTDRRGFCQIGSVKSNIGHTASAAGVLGLLKVALSMKHGQLPATVNFQTPNPDLDSALSPFFVSGQLRAWPKSQRPRRAGLSSFGVGGTNAHMILEEAPARSSDRPRRSHQVITVSARTEAALAAQARGLQARLARTSARGLADIAYTLNLGRAALPHRGVVVCDNPGSAREGLARLARGMGGGARIGDRPSSVAFMFPGQGAQHLGMGSGLYRTEPVYRALIDEGLDAVRRHGGPDLHPVLTAAATADGLLPEVSDTRIAQPALFLMEYALARLLMAWGVTPVAMIGHSIGEYAAAAIAGVLAFDDAVRLVLRRGALMQGMEPGSMLSVAASPEEAIALAGDGVDLAAVNGPRQCVLSGSRDAIAEMADRLATAKIPSVRLRTSHGFHSRMMEPMLEAFGEAFAGVALHPPTLPYVSNLTGDLAAWEDLRDPDAWLGHVRRPVMFARGLQTLVGRGVDLLVEVGPGRQLSALAQQAGVQRQGLRIVALAPQNPGSEGEGPALMEGLARIWTTGGRVDWAAVHAGERRNMVALPAYPFERARFRTGPVSLGLTAQKGKLEVKAWFRAPSWRRAMPPTPSLTTDKETWVIFSGDTAFARRVGAKLTANGARVAHAHGVEATEGPPSSLGARDVFRALQVEGCVPQRLLHLGSLTDDAADITDRAAFQASLDAGLHSLARILEAHTEHFGRAPVTFEIVTHAGQDVMGTEALSAAAATIGAFARVAPQEHPHVRCRLLDLERIVDDGGADQLFAALQTPWAPTVALRGGYGWAPELEIIPAPAADLPSRLKRGGVYMLAGGAGHVGRILANHLARAWEARLVIVGRTALPPRESWEGILADPDAEPEHHDRIRFLTDLEALGGKALYVAADLTAPGAAELARQAAVEAFEKVDGVIYAAGLVGAGCGVSETDQSDCYGRNMDAKALGLAHVLAAFEADELDFGTVVSSISSLLGGLAHAPYAAANLAADALVLQVARSGRQTWTTVNWDLWAGGEIAEGDRRGQARLQTLGIGPEEGVQAFEHLLRMPWRPQVFISTHDLEARLDLWVRGGAKAASPAVGEEAPHTRPHMQTPFQAVEGDLETLLAEIWTRLLGIQGLGRDDDFFEMGGHSLLAVQVAAEVQLARPGLPSANLYMAPTIRRLAEQLETPASATPKPSRAR